MQVILAHYCNCPRNPHLFRGFLHSSALMPGRKRLSHPDCINYSNPYQNCSEYCSRKLAEVELATNQQSFGKKIVEAAGHKGKSHPDCINSFNPYHECSEYCYRKIAESRLTTSQQAFKTETAEVKGKLASFSCSFVDHLLGGFKSLFCVSSWGHKRKSHPYCINFSNPFHECSKYCYHKIAEAIVQSEAISSNNPLVEGTFHPDCMNKWNPYHECTNYCFKRIADARVRIGRDATGQPLDYLSTRRFFDEADLTDSVGIAGTMPIQIQDWNNNNVNLGRCRICIEEPVGCVLTRWTHAGCMGCLQMIKDFGGECPICRARIRTVNGQRLPLCHHVMAETERQTTAKFISFP